MEAAEPAERPLLWGEQIPHHVLQAAREEIAHVRASLEDGPHPLGDLIGISVGTPFTGQFLELVEEHDELPLPIGSELCRQLEEPLDRRVDIR